MNFFFHPELKHKLYLLKSIHNSEKKSFTLTIINSINKYWE